MSITVTQIAEQLKGEVIGDGSTRLTGCAPADCARAGDLTFAEKDPCPASIPAPILMLRLKLIPPPTLDPIA